MKKRTKTNLTLIITFLTLVCTIATLIIAIKSFYYVKSQTNLILEKVEFQAMKQKENKSLSVDDIAHLNNFVNDVTKINTTDDLNSMKEILAVDYNQVYTENNVCKNTVANFTNVCNDVKQKYDTLINSTDSMVLLNNKQALIATLNDFIKMGS
ncbi:hypothetical protein ACFX5K_01680 [Rickettsiales bacterium LUAb2]